MSILSAVPYTWLGLLALWILWLNTGLVVATALRQRRRLGAVRDELREARAAGRLFDAVVVRGEGPLGALAEVRVDQVGRALTVRGPDRILFTDKARHGTLFGGEITSGDRARTIAQSPEVELWIPPPREFGRGDFDAAWSRASTNKGFHTSLAWQVGVDDRIWVQEDAAGRVRRLGAGDAVALCERHRARLFGFVVVALVACAVATVIACWPPLFGSVSTVGGALCLAYFLAIQPLGTAMRDAVRLPHVQPVGGLWNRPERSV